MAGARSSRGSQASQAADDSHVDLVYGADGQNRKQSVREYLRKSVDRAAEMSVPAEDVGKKGGAGLMMIRIGLAVTCVLVYTFQPTLNEFGQVKNAPGITTKVMTNPDGNDKIRWQVKPKSMDPKSDSVSGIPFYKLDGEKVKTNKDATGKVVPEMQYDYELTSTPLKDVLNGYTYNTNTCYVLQVIGEFLIALALTMFYEGGKGIGMIFDLGSMKKLGLVCGVAACAYSLEALAGLGGALLYAVLNQLKLLITAVLMLVVLGKGQSMTAWCLLFSATFACLTFAFIQKGLTKGETYVQIDIAQSNKAKEASIGLEFPMPSSDIEKFSMFWIVFFLLAKVFCSCLSTVLMEKAFKGAGENTAPLPFYVTVAQFKIMVLPFMIFQWVLVWVAGKLMADEWQTFYEKNPSFQYNSWDLFAGWDSATPWLLLTVLIAKNYCVNLMLKVLSSLVKTFAEQAAMCLILLINILQGKFVKDGKMVAMGLAMVAILIAVASYTANKQAEKVASEMAKRLPVSDEESKPLLEGKSK